MSGKDLLIVILFAAGAAALTIVVMSIMELEGPVMYGGAVAGGIAGAIGGALVANKSKTSRG